MSANRMKIGMWNDEETQKEIQKRWRNAQDSRKYEEERWMGNERAVYATSSVQSTDLLRTNLDANYNIGVPGVDGSTADMNVGYTFKNFRFIHAQMSSNPPSVVMRPATSDQEDHRRADAADRVTRYALRQYVLQEKIDQWSLQTLLYGTGILKTIWDASKGAILEFNQETGEILLEGDITVETPSTWNIYLDPDAKQIDQLKWVIERIYVDYDEACMRWPEKKEQLKRARLERVTGAPSPSTSGGKQSLIQDDHYNCVELLQYWETGLATNAHLGRYAITTTGECEVIESCRYSPFRFKKAGAVHKIESDTEMSDEEKEKAIERVPEQALLPYTVLTDVDVPNRIWGRTFVEYVSALQASLGRIDSARLDNLEAHSSPRAILPESAEIADDSLSNSPWDITRISGNQPPYFMSMPQLFPDLTPLRQDHISGIDAVSGVTENSMGNQSREQSAASMQFAVNQANVIRRRLFNKYVLGVESVYRNILNLARKHWTTERTIHVLGKEKALEALDLKGADIDGGYDVVGEYGVSLSLDPLTRRQEVMTMQPLFEKAGVAPLVSLRMMKLSELEGLYDKLDMAGNRQKEIFDEMIATELYIPPKPFRDHKNMIAWALDYFMSSEYNNLPEGVQQLCERHIQERGVLAAQEAGPVAATTPGQPPGPTPQGTAAPMPEAQGQPQMNAG